MDRQTIKRRIFYFFQSFFLVTGIFFLVLIILSFTSLPYKAYHWLGTANSKTIKNSDLIVILGGTGMPSADGLLRTYYGSIVALENKNSKVIIALPYNEGKDSLDQLQQMAHELIVKGVDSTRIEFEPKGFNTRSQAINIFKKYSARVKNLSILIITSPEHMYRSIRTFKKAGFQKVDGIATFETPPEEEKIKDKENAKDKRVKSLALRYNMWSYLHYELYVLREYCAIAYYKLKGWI